MLKEDFHKFVAMAQHLVTADNEHYVCVLVGRARRQMVEAGPTAEQQVVQAFGNQRANTWRVKKFQLCFTRASAAATGVSGVFSEHMYFFYKGMWPSTLVARPRESFGGTTWDDIWLEVPLFKHQEGIAIPYEAKEFIYEEVWNALPGERKGDAVGGKSPKGIKPTGATAELSSAITLPIQVQEDGQLLEPLRHLDYAVDVWRQIFREWEADGALLWTFGNGMGALATIKHDIPALVFVDNDPHLEIATYIVDLHLAIEMQDNAEIQRKIGAAQRGSDHGSDDGDDGYDDAVSKRESKEDEELWI